MKLFHRSRMSFTKKVRVGSKQQTCRVNLTQWTSPPSTTNRSQTFFFFYQFYLFFLHLPQDQSPLLLHSLWDTYNFTHHKISTTLFFSLITGVYLILGKKICTLGNHTKIIKGLMNSSGIYYTCAFCSYFFPGQPLSFARNMVWTYMLMDPMYFFSLFGLSRLGLSSSSLNLVVVGN